MAEVLGICASMVSIIEYARKISDILSRFDIRPLKSPNLCYSELLNESSVVLDRLNFMLALVDQHGPDIGYNSDERRPQSLDSDAISRSTLLTSNKLGLSGYRHKFEYPYLSEVKDAELGASRPDDILGRVLENYRTDYNRSDKGGGKMSKPLLKAGEGRVSNIIFGISVTLGGISAAAISWLHGYLQQDLSHGPSPWLFQFIQWNLQTSSQFLHPETAVVLLLGAIGTFGGSTGYLYYRQQHKCSVDKALIKAIAYGAFLAALLGFDISEIIFRILPGFVLFDLALSGVAI